MKPTKEQLAEAIEDYAAAKATNRPNLIQATAKRLSEYVEALFAPKNPCPDVEPK
jgi:hypothetical protein